MIGIIGGTSIRESDISNHGTARRVVTPYGSCKVFIGEAAVFLARHGPDSDLPPHRINHHANISALKQLGLEGIVGFGSTCSLRNDLTPGSLVVPNDTFAPFRVVTFYNDRIRITIPGLDAPWRERVLDALQKAGLKPVDGGVYIETLGLRFETIAEIRWLAGIGDLVGMTCAAEATLANELDIPYAMVNTIDNYAHGIGVEPLTGERHLQELKKNRATVIKAMKAIVE